VGVACFTRYKELIEQKKLRAHDIYYFVQGMLNHFDTEAVMGLIAPRPFLVLTGDSDEGSLYRESKFLRKNSISFTLFITKRIISKALFTQIPCMYIPGRRKWKCLPGLKNI